MSERAQRLFLPILIVLLLGFLAWLSPGVHAMMQRRSDAMPMSSAGELARRNSSPFAMILGEFRASVSDFMFMKTERYLDSGIAYQPHINVQGMASEKAREASNLANNSTASSAHDDHDHEHPATLIRTQQGDFRGFLGNLEREVKPYRDPRLGHRHTSGEELLPWYRLMTLANPHQVRAYLIGAMWLSQQDKNDEAIAFLKEGIQNNPAHPNLFQLYLSLTTSYVRYHWDEKKCPDWPKLALDAAQKGATQGLQERKKYLGMSPADLSKMPAQWQTDQEEDLQMCMHYVSILQHNAGNDAAARQSALQLRQIAPGLAPNNRLLKTLGVSH